MIAKHPAAANSTYTWQINLKDGSYIEFTAGTN
jgi:hypothetical protein